MMLLVFPRFPIDHCREDVELELSRAAPEVGTQPADGFTSDGRHIAGFKGFDDEATLLHSGASSSSQPKAWPPRCLSPQPCRKGGTQRPHPPPNLIKSGIQRGNQHHNRSKAVTYMHNHSARIGSK